MAKLPSTHYNDRIIGNMLEGESGYTVPWCMWVNLSGDCFLNESYTYHKNPGGTIKMKVTRAKDGYIIDLCGIEDKWTPEDFPGFVTKKEFLYGPVVRIDNTSTTRSRGQNAGFVGINKIERPPVPASIFQRLCKLVFN